MKIEEIRHENVAPDGAMPKGGFVSVDGRIVMSDWGGGCGWTGCNCSPGFWITILSPRSSSGVVRGLKARFDNQEEMKEFFKEYRL